MYVGTDLEVDSPALAGVSNALDSFFTVPCIWQPLVRCSAEEYRIIFSASWFDSGYMYCQSAKAWFSRISTWVYSIPAVDSRPRSLSALAVACAKLGFSDDFAPRAICLLSCCLALMLGIIADMDQTDSCVAAWCSSSRSSTFPSRHRCSFPWSFYHRDSPATVH